MPRRRPCIIPRPPAMVRRIASLQFTTVCLLLLLLLTVAGTLYQVRHGIYAAKARFFAAWLAPLFGVPVLPGGRTVLGLFFLNLIASLLTRFPLRMDRLGLWVLHVGLAVLCLGAFGTYLLSEESVLVLRENQSARVSVSERTWELSFQAAIGTSARRRRIVGVPVSEKSVGTVLVASRGLRLRVDRFVPHCRVTRSGEKAAGRSLIPLDPPRDPAKALPGVVVTVMSPGEGRTLVLWAGDTAPRTVRTPGGSWEVRLRKRRIPLPFSVRLVDVRRTLYPGTQIARGYESTVEIGEGPGARRAVISMNHPLSIRGLTLYQSGYGTDHAGREVSTLQVVRNPVRFLPYAGSILGALGLVLHFLVIPLFRKGRGDAAAPARAPGDGAPSASRSPLSGVET